MRKILIFLLVINSYFLFAYDFEYNFNYYEDFNTENQPENPTWGNIEHRKALHLTDFESGGYYWNFDIQKPYAFAKDLSLLRKSQELYPWSCEYQMVNAQKVNLGGGSTDINKLYSKRLFVTFGVGISSFKMKEFNTFLQTHEIESQKNYETIDKAVSYNLAVSKNFKQLKNIDLELNLECLRVKTKGAADSLFYFDYVWQPGCKTEYSITFVPVMLTALYTIPPAKLINKRLKFKIGVGVNAGIDRWTSTFIYKEIENSELNNANRVYKFEYLAIDFGYHLSSMIIYDLSTTYFLALKGLYRSLNIQDVEDNRKYDHDFSGFDLSINFGFKI